MFKWKDVAHLYLGCKCKGDGTAIYTLFEVKGDGNFLFKTSAGHNIWLGDSYKPMLRQFSSMTTEEVKIIFPYCGPNFNPAEYDSDEFSAREFVELLRRGFDLFKLIESKQALILNA